MPSTRGNRAAACDISASVPGMAERPQVPPYLRAICASGPRCAPQCLRSSRFIAIAMMACADGTRRFSADEIAYLPGGPAPLAWVAGRVGITHGSVSPNLGTNLRRLLPLHCCEVVTRRVF